MATTPQFTATPKLSSAAISTANTNRDGTGSLGSVITGATNGTLLTRITIQATDTTTAGMVRLFIYDGTNTRLYREVPVTAATPSGTVQAFRESLDDLNLILPSAYELKAATNNAEGFIVIAEGNDY